MSERRHYLVTYDISDDKRRTDVFKTLKDQGDHAQFSVFFCDLNLRELAALQTRLDEFIDHRADQVLLLDLGQAENPLEQNLRCLGKPFCPVTRTFVI
jgi:CRISPR-associated protein Cas2